MSSREFKIALTSTIRSYELLDFVHTKVKVPYFINSVGFYLRALLITNGISTTQLDKIMKHYGSRDVPPSIAINDKSMTVVPFGLHRGKGTPEEIISDALYVAKITDRDISKMSSESIYEMMKLFGIGVDCSGLVFNAFLAAFTAAERKEDFVASLSAFASEVSASKIGAKAFYLSSGEISVSEMSAGDIVYKVGDSFDHIALIIEEDNQLFYAQSVVDMCPSGVYVTPITKKKNGVEIIVRSGHDVGEKIMQGKLQVRRLNCITTK